MNQKEVSELRRRWCPEKNAVSRVYGCFVNANKEIVADLDESLGMMPQEEAEQYLGLLKKTLSGTLGKNLIDIVFSTTQVMDGEEHCAASQTVAPPELGFLFPAFDDRRANIYNALFYSRKADELHQEFIDAVFHTEPPMSAAEQKETFQSALADALEDAFNVEVAQAVHERLTDRIIQHKESRDPEPLALTAREVGTILQDCGVVQERVDDFQKKCDEQFGPGAALSPANLIDAGRFQLKTSQATVSVPPENSYLVETRVINGKKYILIPAEEDVEVNGLSVRFAAEE